MEINGRDVLAMLKLTRGDLGRLHKPYITCDICEGYSIAVEQVESFLGATEKDGNTKQV